MPSHVTCIHDVPIPRDRNPVTSIRRRILIISCAQAGSNLRTYLDTLIRAVSVSSRLHTLEILSPKFSKEPAGQTHSASQSSKLH